MSVIDDSGHLFVAPTYSVSTTMVAGQVVSKGVRLSDAKVMINYTFPVGSWTPSALQAKTMEDMAIAMRSP